MRTATIPVRDIGLVAATRGMAGAGAALLLASKMDEQKQKRVGWPLLLIGLLSTVPLAIEVFRHSRKIDTD